MTCPSCSRELPGVFPFCPFCGAALGEQAPRVAREERKVVTVLFADLVGFTARAERLDPEDVRSLLAPYHTHLRAELERYGGTVEKFIGDAVMALFGAPSAREDDPERAVRAAFAIRDWAREQGDELQVRIAVNTGEALVALDARPERGESMAAGDVVNTTARLQAAAPLNGILVGEQTYRATSLSIEYREADAVVAKGKSEPVRAWEALQVRSRVGIDVAPRSTAPLVGRTRELELLASTLARAREESSPQLLTLVGVPGIGKSRLVSELFAIVDRDSELISWRQGRSLPYGDGVTFWALAEIVKAEAGILESDTSEQTREKLARAVSRLGLGTSDTEWIEHQLAPLAGLAEPVVSARAEAFGAWRRFLEAVAALRPLVLVFEDLHWADDALLEFVDHLVDRAGAVPLLVVCTARPELLERRPGWGGGKSNALTISLPPLTDDETVELVSRLAAEPLSVLPELVVRVGGNPLFAEQYTRAMLERRDVELPETVQGIIAARLDALTAAEKHLLQGAAVVGKVFWLGALQAVDGVARWEAEELLFALERKEFVQRSRKSSVASESEYAFRHALIRDVAYGQIPRATRSDMHRHAAGWIESLGRPDEQAELLAHHYVQALELAAAAGLETADLANAARYALRDAGDRAAALYAVEAAERFYDAALELWPEDGVERAELLFRRAVPLGHHVGGGVTEQLAQARDALLACGEHARAAEAEMLLAQSYWIIGRSDLFEEHAARARALIDGAPPSRSNVWILARLATRASIKGERDKAMELAKQARTVAEAVGSNEGLSEVFSLVGLERIFNGDVDGLEDLERGVTLAASTGMLGVEARARNTLAVAHQVVGNLDEAFEARTAAAHVAQRIGSEPLERWFQAVLADHHYRRGEWDVARRMVDEYISGAEDGSQNLLDYQVLGVRAEVRLADGDVAGALADADAALVAGRAAAEVQATSFVLALAAHVHAAGGDRDGALGLARELLDLLRGGLNMQFGAINTMLFASAATRLGLEGELVDALLVGHPRTRWIDAVEAYVSREYVAAADLLEAGGARPDAAEARLRAAELLFADGDDSAAAVQLEQARDFYGTVGATAYVAECETLAESVRSNEIQGRGGVQRG